MKEVALRRTVLCHNKKAASINCTSKHKFFEGSPLISYILNYPLLTTCMRLHLVAALAQVSMLVHTRTTIYTHTFVRKYCGFVAIGYIEATDHLFVAFIVFVSC